MTGYWCSFQILLFEEIELPSELETYTLWLLAWDSHDGTTEGLPFNPPVYAENRVYNLP